MKKEHPIRSLLGLKQEDIAMFLGLSRARWGMYEIGKRDLPLPAKQMLAEMLLWTGLQSLEALTPLSSELPLLPAHERP